MQSVIVQTPSGDYPIHIEAGALGSIARSIPDNASAVIVVTNPTIDALYGETVRQSLQAVSCPVQFVSLPDGEAHKSFDSLSQILDALLAKQRDRRAVIVALGGGVIGDMAGFAAAIYMRGIRFVQIPTTLLAQVDSSVGGKTAVNHPLGKNMIGAFHQPIAVEIDTNVLQTLPQREISAGLAEVIKYGLILDEPFFAWCEANAQALMNRDPEYLSQAIERSCQFKAQVVGADERESGLRAILNLGHTFGHAIEAGLGYGQWLHGEAVGCGLIMAAELSHRVCGLEMAQVERVRALVGAIGCPVRAPALGGADHWFDLMRGDKKAQAGEIQFVLMPRIGEAIVRAAPETAVREVLAVCCESD
ncbi:3-dehydroquinate synthase [Orrella sp. 11846]|uniref:3-dehydroquinate synthase n=1 Tax=Orrella sp. 11846 TaxID=3409913 RepID=UPI003B5A79EB